MTSVETHKIPILITIYLNNVAGLSRIAATRIDTVSNNSHNACKRAFNCITQTYTYSNGLYPAIVFLDAVSYWQ